MSHGERILILDLLKILQKYTDFEHRITQKEIIEILKKKYNTSVERKTVKNNMEKLISYSDLDDANEILHQKSIRKGTDKSTGEETDLVGYTDFGYIHDFTNGELRLIIDSILFSKQIPNSQREELIGKLENLTSKHFNSRIDHIRSLSNNEPNNNEIFLNIEELDKAISASKKVSFQYNRYEIDDKSKLVLKPQRNRDGSPREYMINPYQMVATNGRYYLICNNDYYDNISHYRVDRITNIEILNENRKPMKQVKGLEHGLNLPKHMGEHIYMFTGESVSVSLRFNKRLLSEFIDWFGTVGISFSNQTEEDITASVKVNRIAMRKWALQYALHVRVLSPESLVDEIKEDIAQAWENYE